jgi:CheY-like chemotaxis protein
MTDSRTILLVDDVAMFRELGALFLARVGRVVTAESGEEAIEIARAEKPDLMLVDQLMPGLSGDDVCRFVKTDPGLHDIPVIMLVGDESPSGWGRAVRSGADDVLAKPLSRVTLNETVNRFLRAGRPTGLQRVEVNVPVKLSIGADTRDGRMRNLSRGGVYIETNSTIEEDSEIGLSFVLPDSGSALTPTAQVIWKTRDLGGDSKRPDTGADSESPGIGLRFLDISGESIRTLEDYVFDRAIEPREQLVGAS